MQIYFAAALTLAALVAWVMYFRWSPLTPQNQRAIYAFAPIGAAWLVALLSPFADQTVYKSAILLGMLLALFAALIRTTEFLPSYAAHAHLVITYALYASAFASETHGWPTPYALLLVAAAGLLYYWLYPRLAELWISVAIYGLLILLATWQALELVVQQPATWTSWAALVGMLLLVAATLLEAQARFRQFRPSWASAALPVFLLAQLAIAWSVWG
jgi:uncharacterized membrane protein YhhN